MGNRMKDEGRQSYVAIVLTQMAQYLASIAFNQPNDARLVFVAKDFSKNQVYDSSITSIQDDISLNFGGVVSGSTDYIIVHVNQASAAFQSLSTIELVGELLTVLAMSDTVVAADLQDWWNAEVVIAQQSFLGARRVSDDLSVTMRYRQCWDDSTVTPCPVTATVPNPDSAWDIPINNANNYKHYILNTQQCISGDMLVQVKNHGAMMVKYLEPGMLIMGSDSQNQDSWCTIADVVFVGEGDLYGDFTDGHLLVKSEGTIEANGIVEAKHFGARYSIFTDCPVMKNSNGVKFTPLAETFCGQREMTWDEYLAIWGSINQVVQDTGTFWFHLDSTFTSCNDQSSCGEETWQEALPAICDAMLACATLKTDAACDGFETKAQVFFANHVQEDANQEITNSYTNLGTSISESVRTANTDNSLGRTLVLFLVGMLALLSVGGALVWKFCHRYERLKEANEPQESGLGAASV